MFKADQNAQIGHTARKHGPSKAQMMSRRGALALGACGILALAGCQVRPLYGNQAGLSGTSTTADVLAQIAIDPPADRTTQLVRNELVFGLGEAPTQRYRLALAATRQTRSLGLTGSGATLGRSIVVTATYQLIDTEQNAVLLSNTVSSAASFDSAEQRFANQRATIDAEERAAREVATLIRTQLASAVTASQ